MRPQSPRYIAITLLAAAAAVLWGCASSPSSQGAGFAAEVAPSSHKAEALPGRPGCFWLSNFDGSWTVLNDSELIVYAPLHSRPYLIRLFAPVPTLKFHQRLGFVDSEHTGLICDRAMDDLVVPNWQPQRIPIVAVRELTAPETQRLLAENHVNQGSKPAKGNGSAVH